MKVLVVFAVLCVANAQEWHVNFENNAGCGGGGGGHSSDCLPTYSLSNEVDFGVFNFFNQSISNPDYWNDGFAPEVLHAAAREGGCAVEFGVAPWSECMKTGSGRIPWMLGEGSLFGAYAGCSAAGILTSRSTIYRFTEPWGKMKFEVLTPDTDTEVTAVCYTVNFASNPEQLGRATAPFGAATPVPTSNDDLPSIGNNPAPFGCQAYFGPRPATNFESWTSRADVLLDVGTPTVPAAACLRSCLNKGLAALMSNGEYSTICNKWKTSQENTGIGSPICCIDEAC